MEAASGSTAIAQVHQQEFTGLPPTIVFNIKLRTSITQDLAQHRDHEGSLSRTFSLSGQGAGHGPFESYPDPVDKIPVVASAEIDGHRFGTEHELHLFRYR